MLSALITARDHGDRLSEQELVTFGFTRGPLLGPVRRYRRPVTLTGPSTVTDRRPILTVAPELHARGKVNFEPTTTVHDRGPDGLLRTALRHISHDTPGWADNPHNPDR
jgi:hypothetical protein